MKKKILISFITAIAATVIIFNVTVILGGDNHRYLLNMEDVEAVAQDELSLYAVLIPQQIVCPDGDGSEYKVKCLFAQSTSPSSCSESSCPNCQNNGHKWGDATAGGNVYCGRCGAQKPKSTNDVNYNDVNYCAFAPKRKHDFKYSIGAGRVQCVYCGKVQ